MIRNSLKVAITFKIIFCYWKQYNYISNWKACIFNIGKANPWDKVPVSNEGHRKSRYDDLLGVNTGKFPPPFHSQVWDEESDNEIKKGNETDKFMSQKQISIQR